MSRRGLLGATGLAVAGAVAQPMAPHAAAAGTRAPRSGRHAASDKSVPVPDEFTRHVLSRFTSGVTPQRVRAVGHFADVNGWFERQLTPNKIPDTYADGLYAWFPSLDLTAEQLWNQMQGGMMLGWQVMQDLVRWTMLRRLYSKRQVLESMVDFWGNLLHVPEPSDSSWVWRTDYQKMLRKHAMGSFEDLLFAAETHPAMGIYLDNAVSTAKDLNENLGREVLEMHTVGLNYTQDDVVASARILTGWRVDEWKTWTPYYSPDDHCVGPVQVLDFSDPNDRKDGRNLTKRYLSHLAYHPYTAERLCRRLAVRFVSDSPSDALVQDLAQVYLDSDTQIIPVLRALIASDEFRASVGQKVRTPVEDALATWAVQQVKVAKPTQDTDAANQIMFFSQIIGQQMFDWERPDGFPDTADNWTGACRLLGSMRAHWLTASQFWPNTGITWKPLTEFLPKLPCRFDVLVDSLCRTVLSRQSTDDLLETACAATECQPDEIITPLHRLIQYRLSWLMVAILDSPEHLTR